MGRVFVWTLLPCPAAVGNAGVRKICVLDLSTLPAVADGGRMWEVVAWLKLPGGGMRDMPSRRGMRVLDGSCKEEKRENSIRFVAERNEKNVCKLQGVSSW